VFSLLPRCHGAAGIREIDGYAAGDGEDGVLCHLAALVPGERAAEVFGRLSDLACECGGDSVGTVRFGEPHEHHEAAVPLHQRRNPRRGTVVGAEVQGKRSHQTGAVHRLRSSGTVVVGASVLPGGVGWSRGLDDSRGLCSRAAPDMQVTLAFLVGEGARELVLGDLDEVR
jgi:hypothetical protein